MVVHGRALVLFVSFPIRLLRLDLNAMMASFELAAGFDLAFLPKERNVISRTFFPKTTVPWLIQN